MRIIGVLMCFPAFLHEACKNVELLCAIYSAGLRHRLLRSGGSSIAAQPADELSELLEAKARRIAARSVASDAALCSDSQQHLHAEMYAIMVHVHKVVARYTSSPQQNSTCMTAAAVELLMQETSESMHRDAPRLVRQLGDDGQQKQRDKQPNSPRTRVRQAVHTRQLHNAMRQHAAACEELYGSALRAELRSVSAALPGVQHEDSTGVHQHWSSAGDHFTHAEPLQAQDETSIGNATDASISSSIASRIRNRRLQGLQTSGVSGCAGALRPSRCAKHTSASHGAGQAGKQDRHNTALQQHALQPVAGGTAVRGSKVRANSTLCFTVCDECALPRGHPQPLHCVFYVGNVLRCKAVCI